MLRIETILDFDESSTNLEDFLSGFSLYQWKCLKSPTKGVNKEKKIQKDLIYNPIVWLIIIYKDNVLMKFSVKTMLINYLDDIVKIFEN